MLIVNASSLVWQLYDAVVVGVGVGVCDVAVDELVDKVELVAGDHEHCGRWWWRLLVLLLLLRHRRWIRFALDGRDAIGNE